ncbi:MAG: HEAT repeat domain-containing protein, partial [Planctomycetota bacterium]
MITTGQRITIAILIPVALASVGYALISLVNHLASLEERARNEQRRIAVEKRQEAYERAVEKSKKEHEYGNEENEEGFRLLGPFEIGEMENDAREKILRELLEILKNKSSTPKDFSTAYYILINFREKAPPVLARWLREETDPGVMYAALKACVELKTVYDIDGDSPGDAFLDTALGVLEKADLPARRETARLLGCYRDARAREALARFLRSDDSTLVYYAILSLGQIGTRDDVPRIVPFLSNPDRGLMAAASRAMDSLLSYNAGQDVILLKDYEKALDKE